MGHGDGTPRVALVCDWLTTDTGAERVITAALEIWTEAPLYAVIYRKESLQGTALANRVVRTSFIDRLPFGRSGHRAFLPLMPLAVEQFDLRDFDIVISLSHAVAKGVLTRADQLHISYTFTPARYAWDLYNDYLDDLRMKHPIASWLARLVLHRFRLWDQASGNRPDVMLAASQHVARRVWKTYRRSARVLYPPVDVHRFRPDRDRGDFYVTVSRLVPYKKVELIVEAFNRLSLPLVVIGDGPERHRIERAAGPTVRVLGHQPDASVTDHLERCKAFVFAADEDFGIAPIEAQAAGAPIIAYRRGGILETVAQSATTFLYDHQSVESLAGAIRRFEGAGPISGRDGAEEARRFGKDRFRGEFRAMVDREWSTFRRADAPPVVPSEAPGSARPEPQEVGV